MAEAREPAFEPGDEVLLRYLEEPDRVLGAFPVRVVEDRGERLVVWLAPGTRVRYWSTLDGSDPRLVPIEDRYRSAHGSTERHWYGNGVLRVIPVNQPYQVVHFWGRDGEFSGWYVNFEQTKRWWRNRIETIDWQLDLWFGPDRQPAWKDEDEAAAAVEAGYLSPDDLALARKTGADIIDDFDGWLADLGDWRGWRPPAEWTLPDLPSDWGEAGPPAG